MNGSEIESETAEYSKDLTHVLLL